MTSQIEDFIRKLREPHGLESIAEELIVFYKTKFQEPVFDQSVFREVCKSFWEKIGIWQEVRAMQTLQLYSGAGQQMPPSLGKYIPKTEEARLNQIYVTSQLQQIEGAAQEKLQCELVPDLDKSDDELVKEIIAYAEKYPPTILLDLREWDRMLNIFWMEKYRVYVWHNPVFVSKIKAQATEKIQEMQKEKLLELSKELAGWSAANNVFRLTMEELDLFLLAKRITIPLRVKRILLKFGHKQLAKLLGDATS